MIIPLINYLKLTQLHKETNINIWQPMAKELTVVSNGWQYLRKDGKILTLNFCDTNGKELTIVWHRWHYLGKDGENINIL